MKQKRLLDELQQDDQRRLMRIASVVKRYDPTILLVILLRLVLTLSTVRKGRVLLKDRLLLVTFSRFFSAIILFYSRAFWTASRCLRVASSTMFNFMASDIFPLIWSLPCRKAFCGVVFFCSSS